MRGNAHDRFGERARETGRPKGRYRAPARLHHIVKLASDALDVVRREVWNEARRAGDASGARWLKGARFCLWKRPERLTERQKAKLAQIAKINERLYRACLLKEQLVRHEAPFDTGGDERAPPAACRSRPPKLGAA